MIQTLERTEVFPLNQNRFMSGSSNPDLPRTWNMWYELFTRLFLLTFNKLKYLYISLHHPITCYTIGTKPNVKAVSRPFIRFFSFSKFSLSENKSSIKTNISHINIWLLLF